LILHWRFDLPLEDPVEIHGSSSGVLPAAEWLQVVATHS
jgi:hypothetical protein